MKRKKRACDATQRGLVKECPGCSKMFTTRFPNRVYCDACEDNVTSSRNFHQRRYPRAELMKSGIEGYNG